VLPVEIITNYRNSGETGFIKVAAYYRLAAFQS
jgi:hypothetical protein